MTILRAGTLLIQALCLLTVASADANALCDVTGASTTTLTASTGTYTPPNAPSAQATTLTVSISYIALLGGRCRLAMAFRRTSLPASMAEVSGKTMPYTLQSAASGGSSLLFTGLVPSLSNTLQYTFNAPAIALPASTTTTFTIYAQAQPGNPQRAGSYADSITIDFFNVTLSLILNEVTTQSFLVTGNVNKACTIGGVAQPASDTVTIPITSGGNVNTSTINRSYLNAVCNTPTTVQLTSQNGAVVNAGSVSGLQRLINYAASAAFSGVFATLDTSSIPGAAGPESGVAVQASGDMPTGTIALTITPQLNTQPLLAGSYADTLRISLTPL